MPTFRSDLEGIGRYVPGRGEREIMREYGLDTVVKLASNESPMPPLPSVQRVIQAAAGSVNRYPDTTMLDVTEAVALHEDVPPEAVWFGAGGASLLLNTALAVGGSDTTAVYAHPSFVAYRLVTKISGATAIEVPLDDHHRHDLDAMAAAIRPDTTVVYVCNPNNPTGTHVATADVRAFLDQVPDSVLVVVDEAYHDYVAAEDYSSMAREAVDRPNVVVLHTFSKIYGLAGLRIGYFVGPPQILTSLRRTQLPFAVTDLAQLAATEALRHPQEIEARVAANAAGRTQLSEGLTALGIPVAESQTNFVYALPPLDSDACIEAMLVRGVIVRPTGSPWIRITVGTEAENATCLAALAAAMG